MPLNGSRWFRETIAKARDYVADNVSRRLAVTVGASSFFAVGVVSLAAFGSFTPAMDRGELADEAAALARFETLGAESFDIRPFDRFAYVPPGLMALALPGEPGPDWSTETALADDPAAWSAETHETKTPPPLSFRLSLPSFGGSTPRTPPRARKLYTLKQRLAEIEPAAQTRLAAKFGHAQAAWPPAEITLVAIKDERALELFARSAGGEWKHVHRYRVLAASGGAGPKLRQGDRQVPEGVYGISLLNPNSQYHVSLRVNYPNAFDRQMAVKEGRRDLGGDIMIHGKNLSAGCLAVGDEAAEELFVLAARTGLPKVKLVIAPTDFRKKGLPASDPTQPGWIPQLYTEVASAMAGYKSPAPASTGLLSFLFSK